MRNQNMVSKQEFSPLCDLHHTSMQRVVIEEVASEESQSFHECERRDCSRIYREGMAIRILSTGSAIIRVLMSGSVRRARGYYTSSRWIVY
jgi:hypothetical protein